MSATENSARGARQAPPGTANTGPHFLWVALATLGAALAIYSRTLKLAFAYDDVDLLNVAGDFLSGRVGLGSYLLRVHNQHLLPGFRLLMMASGFFFGTDAYFLRIVLLASHVGSALFLALVARKLYPARETAAATALAYVLPAGLSSMPIWFPTAGTLVPGLVGITGALAAVAHREELGVLRSRAMALLGISIALFFETGLAPLVVSVALLDEWQRRRSGSARGPIGVVGAAGMLLALASVLVVSAATRAQTGAVISLHVVPAAQRAAFLLLVAPFRLLFPGLALPQPFGVAETFPLRLCAFGIVVALLLAAFLSIVVRRRALPLLIASGVSFVGSFGLVLLIGVGRWDSSYEEHYVADRYFFGLLVPLALLAGVAVPSLAAAARSWRATRRRVFAAFAGGALLVEVLLHARAAIDRIPFGVYEDHARRFDQLTLLGRLLSDVAEKIPQGEAPLHFPDGSFFFQDVHNHRVSARVLLSVCVPHRSPRLVLGPPRVSARDEALLNPVLDAWAAAIGERGPYFSIVGGELRNGRDQGFVRFGDGPAEGSLVGGFHQWEGQFRWMGEKAELHLVATGKRVRLTIAAPVAAIGFPVSLAASLRDERTGEAHALGSVEVRRDAIQSNDLEVPEPFASSIENASVRLVLEASRTWRPVDVLPGSRDERTLSVQVYEAGFVP